jgi:UTP--glucose-1-phosphate uridylyltransferase
MRAQRLIGSGPPSRKASEGQGEAFAVFYADDIMHSKKPAIGQLIEAHNKCGASVLGLYKVPKKEVCKYGIAKCNKMGSGPILSVEKLVEKPDPKSAPSQLASVGRFVLTPEIFPKIAKVKKKNGEVYLADAIDMLAKEGKVYGHELEGTWYDCGSKAGFLRANLAFALEHPELKSEARKMLKIL